MTTVAFEPAPAHGRADMILQTSHRVGSRSLLSDESKQRLVDVFTNAVQLYKLVTAVEGLIAEEACKLLLGEKFRM